MTTPADPASAVPTPRRIFALGDTHLGFGIGKTMDRFGAEWVGHADKIRERVRATVSPDDILLIPGDLSWATKRWEAEPDLAFLAALPGIKIVIKGNHDHWWESGKSVNYPGLTPPPVVVNGTGFAGTRGWNVPIEGTETFASDRKTFERERKRLQKSLDAIADCATKIVLLHYPPQPFLDLLAEAGVSVCVYGHVHVNSLPDDEKLAVFGEVLEGVTCYCVACDRIDFTPVEIGAF